MESVFEKIVRKSGMKPINCKCNVCKTQCKQPCFGTPEDMFAIINSGYTDRVQWISVNGIKMISPLYDKDKKSCTFFTNGLCELHDSGLKPTVGKLSHHSATPQNIKMKKLPSLLVIKEWEHLSKDRVEKLISQIKPNQP